MPIITCPKCQGKLRFPDDSPPRRVKCPTCGHTFMSSEGIDPKDPFHSAASRPDLPKARDSKGEFDLPMDDDRSRRGRDYDEDRDRGRGRRRFDDDDDRDRGRRRYDDDYDRDRRSRRRDDDDYDPRRRRRQEEEDYGDRRRRYRDDDDYDDRRRRGPDSRAIEGQFNRASLACLLCFIAGWLQVGALGLMAFSVFLDWCGVQEGLRIFLVIAGLLGLGYWLTSATGLGFLVSGPRERGALGLSIATAATGGLHLLLLIVIATSRYYGTFGAATTARATDVNWHAFVSQIGALPTLLFVLIGLGDLVRGAADGALLPVLTNLAEVARMVLFLLALRAVMFCARDNRGAATCMKSMIGFAIGAGGLVVIGMMFGLLLLGVRPAPGARGGLETLSAVSHLYFLVLYLVLAALGVGVTLIVKSVKGRIDYRR
jgi:hypothetical protein